MNVLLPPLCEFPSMNVAFRSRFLDAGISIEIDTNWMKRYWSLRVSHDYDGIMDEALTILETHRMNSVLGT